MNQQMNKVGQTTRIGPITGDSPSLFDGADAPAAATVTSAEFWNGTITAVSDPFFSVPSQEEDGDPTPDAT